MLLFMSKKILFRQKDKEAKRTIKHKAGKRSAPKGQCRHFAVFLHYPESQKYF